MKIVTLSENTVAWTDPNANLVPVGITGFMRMSHLNAGTALPVGFKTNKKNLIVKIAHLDPCEQTLSRKNASLAH